jgi:hypothetical protein
MGSSSRPASFEEWRDDVVVKMGSSPLWDSIGYQKALFLYDLAWFDCESLVQDLRGKQSRNNSSAVLARLVPISKRGTAVDSAGTMPVFWVMPSAPPVRPRAGISGPGTCYRRTS